MGVSYALCGGAFTAVNKRSQAGCEGQASGKRSRILRALWAMRGRDVDDFAADRSGPGMGEGADGAAQVVGHCRGHQPGRVHREHWGRCTSALSFRSALTCSEFVREENAVNGTSAASAFEIHAAVVSS